MTGKEYEEAADADNFLFVDVKDGIPDFCLWKYFSVCMLYFDKNLIWKSYKHLKSKNLTEKEWILWHCLRNTQHWISKIQGKMDKSTIIEGDFNSFFSEINRASRPKNWWGNRYK